MITPGKLLCPPAVFVLQATFKNASRYAAKDRRTV